MVAGDPDDKSLRNVEKEVLIPKMMRELAKVEKCQAEVNEFKDCCKDSGIWMVLNCRNQNTTMQDCLTKWYRDEGFIKECTELYLAERTEYRRTGISKKQREAGYGNS